MSILRYALMLPSKLCIQYENNTFTVRTQVSYPGEAWVKADLLDFLGASQEEVNDSISHDTVGEALDGVMKSSPHV